MSEIRVNTIANADGTSAPTMTYGFQVPTGMGITGAGGINITGVCTAGIVTATNLYGTLNGNVSGNATGLTGTPNISCGTIAGSTGTFSGAVNVDATTDSTSTTTGALIVDGGAAIAKNVYIGAGLSVAGTLTYEDVTSVDSVGMVTAKSGVNVSGGQLQVGVAYSVGAAGVCTAAGFVGPLTGNVTGNASGSALNVTQAAQTSITSVGTLTGLTVSGDLFFDNGSDAGKDLLWDVSQDALIYKDSVYASFGTDQDMSIWFDGSNSYIQNTTGALKIRAKSGEDGIVLNPDDSVQIYWNNSERIRTTGAGTSTVGISTVQEFSSMGMLKERVKVVANKLSAANNIDLKDGNIYYFTTNETTTATPNIRYDGSHTLNNKMLIGETVTVSIIYKPNGAGYYAALTVDSSGVTEEWNGGSAPSSENSDGYDILTHTLVKIADASFLCFSNVQNYT